MKYIYSFQKLHTAKNLHFGGKAEALAKLSKAGLPVPKGYAMAAEAFWEGTLQEAARMELLDFIETLPKEHTYAVRSSAIGEDGTSASFAGAYETMLDVKKQDVFQAVLDVAASLENERVSVYAKERDMETGKIAVIIQRFIAPSYAGVLFSADIITGNHGIMVGNYVRGVGEQLVSGEAKAQTFTIDAMKFHYTGNAEFAPYSKKLYQYAAKICKLCKGSQDIEWAVYKGKVQILQARPITTLCGRHEDTYAINDSLEGEYLLSKTNVGEIFTSPISPATHSILNAIFDMLGIPLIANIWGQQYANISALCSILVSFGVSKEKAYSIIADMAGNIPEQVEIPVYPFYKGVLLKKLKKVLSAPKKHADFGISKKEFCHHIAFLADKFIEDIRKIEDKQQLAAYWRENCDAYMGQVIGSIMQSVSLNVLFRTREKLEKIAGKELANELCSNCSQNGILESMKPLLGIEEMLSGKLSKEEYVAKYGHRHENELELSAPYPYENPDFPENIIEDYKNSGINVHEMKKRQEQRYKEAVEQFKSLYPKKSRWLDKTLDKFSKAAYVREDVRSQSVKLFCLMREFLLRAGVLTGIGDDIFMLYFQEVFRVLHGEEEPLKHIKERRENYEAYKSMPPFPNIIIGRFEPEKWAENPNRRTDLYQFGEENLLDEEAAVKGFPGSSGRVEGIVRVLTDISQIDSFVEGEILVTTATNIGWVRIFPKVSAIITDIGAPLSHAAIVARELGIPAVVGCGNATMCLKTGDRVVVDGTKGEIYKAT